ncbi:hypothetical protein [Acinetobacter baumannii]|uniref:hypothetical protein n=1 Tax=Acinetobacter baumannii TaxID=470 RepID=UPI0013602F98|nr:hypothetical protein [Acinetobacter baumannii]MDC5637382.1 hypothetical protein [Acinetobacter baumannii]CAA0261682.1 hypothetical protein AB945B12_03017 [Acinetobacter baumannii]
MKASKLIREKGLQYAKEIVDSAPSNATEWNEGFEFQCGQSIEISKADREKYFVDLSELKRLVESLGYVSRWGGIERCKKLYFEAPFKRDKHIKDLKRYIRDYESIYGGVENA